MVFDYYDRTTTDMGTAAINAVTGLRSYLPSIVPNETDAQYCARNQIHCGATAGPDNCLNVRNVPSCGTCGAGQFCSGGACACQPESNAAFCARQ